MEIDKRKKSILNIICIIAFCILGIVGYKQRKHLEDTGTYSICTITGHRDAYRGFYAEGTFYYKGKKRTFDRKSSVVAAGQYAVGTSHFVAFFDEKRTITIIDTVPTWYTLGAPTEGWIRHPFESELRRMMRLGRIIPVKDPVNWKKKQIPKKKTYLFESLVAMEPLIKWSSFTRITVEDIPKNTYEYGDIVVFNKPGGGTGLSRIAALPGDLIALNNNICSINGKENIWKKTQEEVPYVITNFKTNYTLYVDELEEIFPNGAKVNIYRPKENDRDPLITSFETLTVPEGHYFLLSDARSYGKDSRHIGPVEAKNLKGVAISIEGLPNY